MITGIAGYIRLLQDPVHRYQDRQQRSHQLLPSQGARGEVRQTTAVTPTSPFSRSTWKGKTDNSGHTNLSLLKEHVERLDDCSASFVLLAQSCRVEF